MLYAKWRPLCLGLNVLTVRWAAHITRSLWQYIHYLMSKLAHKWWSMTINWSSHNSTCSVYYNHNCTMDPCGISCGKGISHYVHIQYFLFSRHPENACMVNGQNRGNPACLPHPPHPHPHPTPTNQLCFGQVKKKICWQWAFCHQGSIQGSLISKVLILAIFYAEVQVVDLLLILSQ